MTEYCPHCRTMRRARKTTRTRQEVRDGDTVTLRTHTYACAQCGRFLYSNEQIMRGPAAEAQESEAPAAAEEAAATGPGAGGEGE